MFVFFKKKGDKAIRVIIIAWIKYCINQLIENRPDGQDVINRLQVIFDNVHGGEIRLKHVENVTGNDCERCLSLEKYLDKNICWCCFMIDQMNHIGNEVSISNDRIEKMRLDIGQLKPMVTSIMDVLSGLDSRFTNAIPRLFLLVPVERQKFKEKPKSWCRSLFQNKYDLYFICAIFPKLSQTARRRLTWTNLGTRHRIFLIL